MHLTVSKTDAPRAGLFLLGYVLMWMLLVFPVFHQMNFKSGTDIYSWIWIICYSGLSICTAYSLSLFIAYLFVDSNPRLPELKTRLTTTTAVIVCPVRNEEIGLYERLQFTLKDNIGNGVDFWLISDSDAASEPRELETIARLRIDYPGTNIFYRRRDIHKDFKPGNISDWLILHDGCRYDYFFVLDADSLMVPNTMDKLLRIADHPQNDDIGHFQCQTDIVHDFTHLSHLAKINLKFCERLIFKTTYAVFGQWISYGHSNLIRTQAFIRADLPTDELSHDVFDIALLDRAGYRSVLLSDITVYEEAPANYLEAHKRDRRWTQGSLSACKLLLDDRISLVERFYVFHGGWAYVSNFLGLIWLFLQFGDMVVGHHDINRFPATMAWGSFSINFILFLETVLTIGMIWGAPFMVVKSFQEIVEFAWSVLFGNLTFFNNVVQGARNVISVIISPLHKWTPMGKDPFINNPFSVLFKEIRLTVFISALLLVFAWKTDHIWWIILAGPLVVGGILSPVTLWWSGRTRSIPANLKGE